MELVPPKRFGVMIGDEVIDLRKSLNPLKRDGKTAYQAEYVIGRPGDHLFFVEPQPYWEPAEGKMIIHYTKVIVDGFDAGTGWDQAIGLPVEIEPLSRPTSLWSGNVFQGIVRKNGEPQPFAEVEVEYRAEGKAKAPAPAFETQVIKADANGVFTYGLAKAGWWGFAALIEADDPMTAPTGQSVPVELGGLLWVKTEPLTVQR